MSSSKSIYKGEQLQNVIFTYKAREIPLTLSAVAQEFVSAPAFQNTDFRMNPLAAQQSGVAQLQKDVLNEKIEEEVLNQIKDIQEKAYKEAYDLGFVEGCNQALLERQEILKQKLEQWDNLLAELNTMKSRLIADHEAHIVEMIYYLANRIAMKDIKADPASIIPVILQVAQEAQSDEQLTIRLAPEDFQFIEDIKLKNGKTSDALKGIKFEALEGLTPGGCRLESNYGSIDATLETRMSRAWEFLMERVPHKDQRSEKIGTDDGD